MMRLPPFTYLQPASVDEALALARQHGPEACYVAGGTDLWPNMKRRQLSPPVVISLARLAELRGIEITEEGGLRIGALTTLTELAAAPAVRERWPVVAEAAALISTPPLRNMGTIGGNLLIDTRCTYYDQSYAWRKAIDFCMKKDGKICWVAPSSPRCWAVQSSDEAPVMCAIGARLTFRSPHGGERELEADALYRDDGIAHLTKQPLELLTHITLPPPRGWRAHYIKLRRRGSF
ncbi:MAG: 4-hydroxybenzoyl-CoA reductase, partial [Planctomycetota bacterium]